ncbi:unnamed protein product, partial [marine sediment metagenome]
HFFFLYINIYVYIKQLLRLNENNGEGISKIFRQIYY